MFRHDGIGGHVAGGIEDYAISFVRFENKREERFGYFNKAEEVDLEAFANHGKVNVSSILRFPQ